MAEYINREELLQSIRNGAGTDLQKLFANLCVRVPKNTDVIDVVLCKDCKHYIDNDKFKNLCDFHQSEVYRNDFCSYGERKEK